MTRYKNTKKRREEKKREEKRREEKRREDKRKKRRGVHKDLKAHANNEGLRKEGKLQTINI